MTGEVLHTNGGEIINGFFLQAEVVIRDLVRSRGLGDVYKRQHHGGLALVRHGGVVGGMDLHRIMTAAAQAASYTHLTLSTSDLV